MQGKDRPNDNFIITKRKIHDEMPDKNTIASCKGGKMTIYTKIINSPSDGLKNIVDIWIRSCQLISDTRLQEVSVKDMRTILLLVSMVKDKSRDP